VRYKNQLCLATMAIVCVVFSQHTQAAEVSTLDHSSLSQMTWMPSEMMLCAVVLTEPANSSDELVATQEQPVDEAPTLADKSTLDHAMIHQYADHSSVLGNVIDPIEIHVRHATSLSSVTGLSSDVASEVQVIETKTLPRGVIDPMEAVRLHRKSATKTPSSVRVPSTVQKVAPVTAGPTFGITLSTILVVLGFSAAGYVAMRVRRAMV
jgi:hypothetical protein